MVIGTYCGLFEPWRGGATVLFFVCRENSMILIRHKTNKISLYAINILKEATGKLQIILWTFFLSTFFIKAIDK